MDKKLHSNREQYDNYTGMDGEQQLTADIADYFVSKSQSIPKP